jgi:hypothetical protein
MGQKALKNSSMVSYTGYYPTPEAYESGLLVSSFNQSADTDRQALKTSSVTRFPECCVNQSSCEFQDYCNHLYFIHERCNCASTWKKTAGLALPTSA